ncbi:MAG TPA: tRNA preQ1(34) S-adenosylmethionine ribosyltransferase-isomerase QueA [Acidimicrobiia bacterium]|nr:tRNA preQ1(34) S-adenosylmethionine ribosyltransferase-isomerase QueA [Acidimicrobiia bacterium]
MRTADFDYELPAEAIAQTPIEPRDAARLLDTTTMADHLFTDLPHLIRPADLVVVNRTKVRAARLWGHKPLSGGKVEALLLRQLGPARWQAVVRPARRLRPGSTIDFGGVTAVVESLAEGTAVLQLDAKSAMAAAGELPLPPYIHHQIPDPGRYQTIFAREEGSAAAPTAALHFTSRVVAAFRSRGIEMTEVVLHIGLDTFRPISTAEIDQHRIHEEEFVVGEEAVAAVEACRARRGRVVAVGTTVVRTLESVAMPGGLIRAGRGETGLYITPGYEFMVVDGLVTNFHLPRTTLLVLLAAFMGDRWREAYQVALARGYRFASFGDAMYAERPR